MFKDMPNSDLAAVSLLGLCNSVAQHPQGAASLQKQYGHAASVKAGEAVNRLYVTSASGQPYAYGDGNTTQNRTLKFFLGPGPSTFHKLR